MNEYSDTASGRQDQTQNKMTVDEYQIATWYSEGVPEPYMAINMTQAVKMLDGYSLTLEEKTELPALMAGYYRLIEEAGLAGYGETEFESIQDLFSNATPTEDKS